MTTWSLTTRAMRRSATRSADISSMARRGPTSSGRASLPDGRWFQVNERRMPNGGVAVVWTDISRLHAEMELHRQTAAELRELKASLEQRVEERTAELQQA